MTCQKQNNRRPIDRLIVKDMTKLQVAKYMDVIVNHFLAGEVGPTIRQAELAMDYMNKQLYVQSDIVNVLFEVIGLTLYLINRDKPEWSDDLNEKRILFILVSNADKNDAYNNVFQESYFGPTNYNSR